MAEKKTLDFEASMQRLEQIVRMLEKGDAPLEDAMKLFEEGTKLASACNTMLDKAEKKVFRLTKGADGMPLETEFELGE